MESVSASIGYMIFSMVMSWIIILVFMNIVHLICKHILFNPQRSSNYKQNSITMLKIAVCIWITIISHQTIHSIILNILLLPHISNDSYCSIFGKIENIVFGIVGFLSMFLLIQIFKYVPESSAYYYHIKGLQIWAVLLFLIRCIATIFEDNFETKSINNHFSKYQVCTLQQNHYDETWIQKLSRFVFPLFLLTFMILSILFTNSVWRQIKSMKFYKYSSSSNFKTVEKTMSVVIRHCILWTQCLIINSILKVILWQIFTRNLAFNPNPTILLFDGMCIYMLFDFGDNKYYILYGWLHYKCLNYWRERHRVAISIINKSESKSKSKSKSGSKTWSGSLSNVHRGSITSLSSIDETRAIIFPAECDSIV